MAIDYATDIFPLYATNVVTDAEYLAVDAANRNQTSEQNILTTIEVLRAHMTALRSDEEARLLHYCVSRMLAGVAYNDVYDQISAYVVGNVKAVGSAFANGDTISITTASGTDAIVLDSAPFASLAAVAADINSLFVNTDEVEAYVSDGKLGFRNSTGNEGVPFTLAHGAGPSIMNKSGITAGTYYGEIERIANSARDDAIARFEAVGRPESGDL